LPSSDSDTGSHVARIGAHKRHGCVDGDPVLEHARRDLRAAKLAAHVRRTVDAAPPLTAEQRSRIAALLFCGAA
jgi:hypothetical protein